MIARGVGVENYEIVSLSLPLWDCFGRFEKLARILWLVGPRSVFRPFQLNFKSFRAYLKAVHCGNGALG